VKTVQQIVFVVDDDEAVRDALKMLFRATGLSVIAYASAASFLKDVSFDRPGCIVLDVRMPGMSGLALQEELRLRRIRMPIVFLTGHADVPMAVRTLKEGAFDFIEKPIESSKLVGAVQQALAFDMAQRQQVSPRKIEPADSALSVLTAREREVAELVVQGRQTREIAEQLGISIKTVEFHRAHVREKLGVTSLAELVKVFLVG
jgi:two-component system, LuxR family, response regulator FixJ